jgi:hypothetical protein
MDKENFDKELQARFPGNYQPFRSNGYPLNANIVYVGYNFSSSINKPFLDYWDKEHGYNYKAFRDQREAKEMSASFPLDKAMTIACERALTTRPRVTCLDPGWVAIFLGVWHCAQQSRLSSTSIRRSVFSYLTIALDAQW